MTKITIIVPVYQVEDYLDRCVQSLMKQTYSELEIILVDDGSVDSSPQMCDQYAKIDNRVKVIHKENGGLSSARNSGIDVATGDYIMFVDSDDYIELDTCQRLYELIDEATDIVSFGFSHFYDDHCEKVTNTDSIITLCGDEVFEYYINRKNVTHMVTDKLFKRELFDGVRFIEGRLAEDLAICFQLVGKCNKLIAYDHVFYQYYMRGNSIMGTGSLKLCLDAYKGELEAYEYGKAHFPQFNVQNDVRLLNQSMKTYLKLLKVHRKNTNEEELKILNDRIQALQKTEVPIRTKLFSIAFNANKSLTWMIFKACKMS